MKKERSTEMFDQAKVKSIMISGHTDRPACPREHGGYFAYSGITEETGTRS